jgi:hypothetical protein
VVQVIDIVTDRSNFDLCKAELRFLGLVELAVNH